VNADEPHPVIWLIEPNRTLVRVVRDHLTEAGLPVRRTFASHKKMWRWSTKHPAEQPDLIILELDGDDAGCLVPIRTDAQLSRAVIIVLSKHQKASIVAQACHIGAFAFLEKSQGTAIIPTFVLRALSPQTPVGPPSVIV
jgi:DNA-binding NtrC family response regulator